jgi:hypothetical protein
LPGCIALHDTNYGTRKEMEITFTDKHEEEEEERRLIRETATPPIHFFSVTSSTFIFLIVTKIPLIIT